MKTDLYTKAVLTAIAGLLAWNAVNHLAHADNQITLNNLSDQIADVGSAVDRLQQSVDNIGTDVSDIKTQTQNN